MDYKISEIRKKVFLIESKTQYEICSMFMRAQEFYESSFPNIRNKFFSLEELMDTYAQKSGNFTYFQDWSGFNIPSNIIKKFFETFAFDLNRKENVFYNMINSMVPNLEGDFYIIGTFQDRNKTALKHEIAHAYYYLHEHYVTFVDELLNKMKPELYYKARNSLIENFKYNERVVDDEIQAYLSTENDINDIKTIFNWNKKVKIPSSFKSFFKKFDLTHK